MNYIVFDLEFNQNIPSIDASDNKNTKDLIEKFQKEKLPFEILQIGAIKLDSSFQTISTFNRLVKPSLYSEVSSFVTELTGITTEQVMKEDPFHTVYCDFIEFIHDSESIFCVWGNVDIKELYRSANYYDLDTSRLPKHYINIQPYASLHFGITNKRLLQLKHTVERLNIPISYEFHNALNDAYYTAEILKNIYNTSMQPKIYDPNYVKVKTRPQKKVIDYASLIKQFEKMYKRSMSEEEKAIIILSYKMGKTNQFLI